MSETRHSIANQVSAALNLIVSGSGGFKRRVENMQSMAIDARFDPTKSSTTEGVAAVRAGLAATQQIIHAMYDLADDIDVLAGELVDLLAMEQPFDLQ